MRKLIGFLIVGIALVVAAPGCDKKAEGDAAAEKKDDKKAEKKADDKKADDKKAEKKADKKAAKASGKAVYRSSKGSPTWAGPASADMEGSLTVPN